MVIFTFIYDYAGQNVHIHIFYDYIAFNVVIYCFKIFICHQIFNH